MCLRVPFNLCSDQLSHIPQRQIGPVLIDQDVISLWQCLLFSVVFDAVIVAEPGGDGSQRILSVSLHSERQQQSRGGSEEQVAFFSR